MKSKVIKSRHYILEMLEEGRLTSGAKIPGARTLAQDSGISFVKVQEGIESLVKDGILYTQPRQGTFVEKNWHEKILPSIVSLYGKRERFPWLLDAESIINTVIPDLMFLKSFLKSIYEIRTSISVIHDQHNYMDLSPIFSELFPDQSDFFMTSFKPFMTEEKLFGIPFSISPRVLYINPNWLEKVNFAIPKPYWTWQQFLDCITLLKKVLPIERIFNFHTRPYLWMNIIFRAGGCLINPNSEDPVKIDSPETQRGIQLFRQLQKNISQTPIAELPEYDQHFADGNCAFYIGTRQFLPKLKKGNLKNWITAPIPHFDDNTDMNVQGTDLICIRKSCPDIEIAKQFIKLMLSTEIQDILAREQYGIPVRKSSATKSIDFSNANDTLFLNEIPKMSAEYNINSPELSNLIYQGISEIWEKDLDIEQTTKELADAVRVLLKIRANR